MDGDCNIVNEIMNFARVSPTANSSQPITTRYGDGVIEPGLIASLNREQKMDQQTRHTKEKEINLK